MSNRSLMIPGRSLMPSPFSMSPPTTIEVEETHERKYKKKTKKPDGTTVTEERVEKDSVSVGASCSIQ